MVRIYHILFIHLMMNIMFYFFIILNKYVKGVCMQVFEYIHTDLISLGQLYIYIYNLNKNLGKSLPK